MDAWWRQYAAEVSAEKKKVREHKNEDKQERKNMYALHADPVLSHLTIALAFTLSSSKPGALLQIFPFRIRNGTR